MKGPGKPADPQRREELVAALRRRQALREKGYRAQALKVLPHVCARCGREFDGARLRELTVHHRDHDYRNNPPDGSNWELLCLYCHDHEHEKFRMKGYDGVSADAAPPPPSTFSPFEGLDDLLDRKKP